MSFLRIVKTIVCAAVVLLATAGGIRPQAGWAAAATKLPSWVKVDAAHRTVSLKITAAEGGANGTLNFNGYGNGQMTVVVPAGWRVHIDFANTGAGALPHSVEVIRAVPASKIPPQAIPPAIPRAESRYLVAGIPHSRPTALISRRSRLASTSGSAGCRHTARKACGTG